MSIKGSESPSEQTDQNDFIRALQSNQQQLAKIQQQLDDILNNNQNESEIIPRKSHRNLQCCLVYTYVAETITTTTEINAWDVCFPHDFSQPQRLFFGFLVRNMDHYHAMLFEFCGKCSRMGTHFESQYHLQTNTNLSVQTPVKPNTNLLVQTPAKPNE
ncbi:34723_t:CDS:2 [Gigaspora margarita]|uniref:34723_t:CDS:1 n=1 Tax=Gigaspora margarita TaxID=4874 RepID=A0ABN7UZK0_GIGMA|nr:34723_t:CDS:2 [Gigaspora margarita]